MISLRWSSIFIINQSPASSSIIFSLIAIMIIIISHAIDIFDNINNIAHHRHNYSQVLNHFLTCLFLWITFDISFSRRSSFLSEQYYDAWKVLCEHDTWKAFFFLILLTHKNRDTSTKLNPSDLISWHIRLLSYFLP